VEKVWNRGEQLGKENFTVIIHGKSYHEETRATFSHTISNAASLIIRDIDEANLLASFILDQKRAEEFYKAFDGKYSTGFKIEHDLQKIGVVNQTTMLATETQAIADLLKETMVKKYGVEQLADHFADTRDTLCYATNDNQEATYGLLQGNADFAIVVGGYNSSNTSHIVKLCEEKLPTYFISSGAKILNPKLIRHFNIKEHKEIESENFLPKKNVIDIILTSGASCPDAVVEDVLRKIHSFFPQAKDVDETIETFLSIRE
jgi:4-hydroxy-3-methylbut-2-enyl diphosphate reductase